MVNVHHGIAYCHRFEIEFQFPQMFQQFPKKNLGEENLSTSFRKQVYFSIFLPIVAWKDLGATTDPCISRQFMLQNGLISTLLLLTL